MTPTYLLQRARDVLIRVEWSADFCDGPACPDCFSAPHLGHFKGCALKRIIDITESRVDKAERRKKDTGCSYCPPHRKENAGRKPKHGAQKPKAKR